MDEHHLRAQLLHDSPEIAGEELPPMDVAEGAGVLSTRFSRRVVGSVDNYSILLAKVVTVPYGKRLAITFATAELRVGDTAELITVYMYCQWPTQHFLLPTKVFDRSVSTGITGTDYWTISQPTRLVALVGEEVWVVAVKSRNQGTMTATFSLFGDLEDA